MPMTHLSLGITGMAIAAAMVGPKPLSKPVNFECPHCGQMTAMKDAHLDAEDRLVCAEGMLANPSPDDVAGAFHDAEVADA